MQPLEVHGVDGVLLRLEPAAGDLGKDDLNEAVCPGERLPGRYQGDGHWSKISPQKPRLGLDGVGLDPDAVLVAGLRASHLLEGLGLALTALVVEPAMIVTAEAAVLRDPVRQVGATVGAVAVEESIRAALVPVKD